MSEKKTRWIGHRIIYSDGWKWIEKDSDLTKREIQVTKLIFDGLTKSAIASRLDISKHTVDTFIRRIYERVGVTNRPQLMAILMYQVFYVRVTQTRD